MNYYNCIVTRNLSPFGLCIRIHMKIAFLFINETSLIIASAIVEIRCDSIRLRNNIIVGNYIKRKRIDFSPAVNYDRL